MSDKDLVHVVSFSGGKDSTAMLLRMVEEGMHIDRIICVDTTKEFPEMYEHIKKVQEYITPLKIEITSFDFSYYLGEYIKTRGKNKGKRGYGWPDFMNRWCTTLKKQAVSKIVGRDALQYHGIAYDERERAGRNRDLNIRYPLIEWEMTEQDALQYCYDRGFDWGGLYEKFARVSCYCCPLARLGELKTIYTEFPHLWEDMQRLDERSYRKFRSDYTLTELEEKFKE